MPCHHRIIHTLTTAAALAICLPSALPAALAQTTRPASQPAATSPSGPAGAQLTEEERAAGFRPLFNGRDLSGWVHKGKVGSFRVEDGQIIGDRPERSDLAYWLAADHEYADFELRLQYKLSPNGNSGIFIRIPPEGWPSIAGMEIQLLDDRGKTGRPTTRDTGSIYRIVAPSAFASKPAGQWNDLWILCDGDHVRVTMNGRRIIDTRMSDHEKLKDHPRKGAIGLSAHTYPVYFRNIRLREITKTE